MFSAIASFAQRRRKLVVLGGVVFFLAAGAIGGSVADRLDPYGADDPDTESVIASDRLEQKGFRDASVVVLIEDGKVASAGGRSRVREIERKVAEEPEVATVSGYLETGSRDFISDDG